MLYVYGSRFFEPSKNRKFVQKIGGFENSRVKMQCLTKEVKPLLVRVIGCFEKSRGREIGIPLVKDRTLLSTLASSLQLYQLSTICELFQLYPLLKNSLVFADYCSVRTCKGRLSRLDRSTCYAKTCLTLFNVILLSSIIKLYCCYDKLCFRNNLFYNAARPHHEKSVMLAVNCSLKNSCVGSCGKYEI